MGLAICSAFLSRNSPLLLLPHPVLLLLLLLLAVDHDVQVDAAAVLQPLLKHAWTLWQLLITSQPLMVVGLTPRCAAVIWRK
jgi:hypothetical protein